MRQKTEWELLLAEGWKNLDAKVLAEVARDLEKTDSAGATIVQGLSLSLVGRISEAQEKYDCSVSRVLHRGLFWLGTIDGMYNSTRSNAQASKETLRKLMKWGSAIYFQTSGELRHQLLHHLFYVWWITRFWNDQVLTLLIAVGHWVYGILFWRQEARLHGKINTGHILNILGIPFLGVPLVIGAYRKIDLLRPWLRHVVLSYMPYGLYISGRREDVVASMLEKAAVVIPAQGDRYYWILLLVTQLRFASQKGDIAGSEAAASALIDLSKVAKNKKFFFGAKADLALCYGVRGLLWKCEELLKELESHNPDDSDPVVAGSYYRLRGWTYFFVGKYELAIEDARSALICFRRARSFWLPIQFALLLRLVSELRIRMASSTDAEYSQRLLTRHVRRLRAARKSYRSNYVLTRMVNDELNAIQFGLSRFSRPCYSWDVNILSCQRKLFSMLDTLLLPGSDDTFWATISQPLETALGIRFTERLCREGISSFTVRLASSYPRALELNIDRAGESDSKNEIIRFSTLNEGQATPSQLDGLYTMYPVLKCIVRIRELQITMLEQARLGAVAETARRVAHDIRSPLTALQVVLSNAKLPEKDRALAQTAFQRMVDIASSLVAEPLPRAGASVKAEENLKDTERLESEHIPGLVESILSEKRIQYRTLC